jgi:ADP-dependent NAD(P)H-hydrate dehydratase / NAD(P)H-hydrate epimerase
MKLFRSDQIKQIDEFTINEEPVLSVDLMERAARQLLTWYMNVFDRSHRVLIFAGPGNNGGDGLALARLLDSNRYEALVYYIEFTDKTSADWKTNLDRLERDTKVKIISLKESEHFPAINEDDIIIDAIFGSGLTRPVNGLATEIVKLINQSGARVISIDIPSGMFGEDNTSNNYESIIKADFTLSFQFPKLCFMLPENAENIGDWMILPIGLSQNAIRNIISPYSWTLKSDVAPLIKKRRKFDHKGTYGHGLLIAGSKAKMGAAVLGAGAALRSGIGLISCHIPLCGIPVIQSSIPEAMTDPDENDMIFSKAGNTSTYSAIGVGPGIGTEQITQNAFYELLKNCRKPIVIDADGLNILALNKEWYSLIPEGSILTPHPKEFERLAGKSENSYIRLKRQLEFSEKHKCIVVLKGANSSISTPEGNVFFNSTGNPGMATAGSGDVLTGILLSLLSQGYTPENAAVLGVYLHGLAGDIAAQELCYESIVASDIINNLSKAFKNLKEE